MDWIYALIAVALVAVFLLLKRAGQISSKAAVACLRDGAMVIDVRSAAEYTSAHLPNAVNMPVSEIKALAQFAGVAVQQRLVGGRVGGRIASLREHQRALFQVTFLSVAQTEG